MAVIVVCPTCKARIKAPDEVIGRTFGCRSCKTILLAPRYSLAESSVPECADEDDGEQPTGRRGRRRSRQEPRESLPGTSYLQSALLKKEKILCAAELHWFILLRPVLVLIPAVVAGTYFQILASRETDFFEAYYKGLFAGLLYYLGVVAAGIQLLFAIMRWRFSQFGVTDRRLLIREGRIYHRTIGIPLEQVGMLTIRPGIFGRLLGYGTLEIQGDEVRTKIRDILAPLEFYDEIRNAAGRQRGPGNQNHVD